MEPDDAKLVERAQRGDSEAFGELVRRHSRYLFSVAYRVTGDESLAEDVVQDTFLKAWERIGRFDFRARFSTWIYRIAVNRGIDLMRRKQRHSEDPVPTEAGEEALGASEAPDPHRLAVSGELGRQALELLRSLTPMERASFVLRHMEGHSIAEIGQVLGTRTSATKHAVFRAVRKLRSGLEPFMGEDHEAAVG
jgi:RNA polymerase sigma-70 factor (ECF subfamily)